MLLGALTIGGNTATAQRVPNYYSVVGLTFYYVEPSYSTATGTGPGFLIPPLYAANAAWNVQDVRTRVEFYNAGGSSLPMHVQAQDTLGGPIGDATTGCTGTTPGSCLLRFARGTFWYNGTGFLPAGATDFVSVALHEFGHLVGLGHSESQLQAEVAGGWFTGQPALGGEGANVVRRAIHIDDIQGARIARPVLSGDSYNMLANGTFDTAIPYGPSGYVAGSSYITGWAFSDQGQPGAAYFPYPGGKSSANYMAFVSRTGVNASAIYQDFFFEPTAVDGTPPSYMRTSSRSASGWFRQRAALLALWETDTGALHYTEFTGSTGTSPWTYVSVPFYNPDASQHVMLAVYDWGSSGTVDVDQLSVIWGGL